MVRGFGRTIARPSFEKRKTSHDAKPNDNGEQKEKVIDTHEKLEETTTMTYWDKNGDKQARGLEVKVYQVDSSEKGGYKELTLIKSAWEADNGPHATGLTAYNAVGTVKKESEDIRLLRETKVPRSATFVAAIRLFEGDETGGGRWPGLPPTSQVFYDHIGVHP